MMRLAPALAKRPSLWPAALRALARFAPDRWWSRPPFLPLPSAGLLAFRSEAMHGDRSAVPSASEVIIWLEWCRSQPG